MSKNKSRTPAIMSRTSAELRKENPDLKVLQDGIQYLLGHGHDHRIDELFANEAHTQEALDDLDFVLIETAYRCDLRNPKNNTSLYQIPMAFLVTIVSSKGVPSQLDPTAMTKQKLLRNGLDLGDDPDVIIDGTLYRPDLADWDSPSAAYHYLRAPYNGIALPFGGKLPSKVAPTAQPSVYHRVILASVIGLESAHEETDERIFGTDETSVEIRAEQRLAIEAILSAQIGAEHVALCPIPLELFDVTATIWEIDRQWRIAKAIEQGLDRMLEVTPTNQAIKPELHVFLPPSTNNDCYEITLAGFMPFAPEPLWKCDITASSEFDNDENLKTTIEMAAELFCQAKIVAHDHMFDGTTGCMTVNLATQTNQ